VVLYFCDALSAAVNAKGAVPCVTAAQSAHVFLNVIRGMEDPKFVPEERETFLNTLLGYVFIFPLCFLLRVVIDVFFFWCVFFLAMDRYAEKRDVRGVDRILVSYDTKYRRRNHEKLRAAR
jgi:hypothetical protein